MSNFTTELKLDYFDDFMFKLEFYDTDVKGLKNEAIIHYKDTMGKSATLTSKIVGELMATWVYCGTPYNQAKEAIVALTKFAIRHISFRIPMEIHRVMLMLTFPLIVEIMKIASAYGDNIFTNDMIIDQIEGDYGAETTKEEAVKKALLTMYNLGMIKRYKKGIYKLYHWPVFNVLGLASVLYAAEAMAKDNASNDNPALMGLSLEVNHEFVKHFNKIDYSVIVGKELWTEFEAANDSCTLQLQDGKWTISDEPFVYQGLNRTIDKIPARIRLSVPELKEFYAKAENEKNLGQGLSESNQ